MAVWDIANVRVHDNNFNYNAQFYGYNASNKVPTWLAFDTFAVSPLNLPPPGRLLGPSWLVFSLLLHPPLVFCFHLLVVLGYSVNAGVYKGTFRNRHIGSRILLPPSRKISSLVFQ